MPNTLALRGLSMARGISARALAPIRKAQPAAAAAIAPPPYPARSRAAFGAPREMRLDDAAALKALYESVWFPPRSSAGWAWLAAMPGRPDSPLGWVIEDEQGVCACLGRFTQNVYLNGERLTGASNFYLIVHPRARGASKALNQISLADDGAASVCVLTMNELSADLGKRFGFTAWPDGMANVKYVWRMKKIAIAMERVLRWWHGRSDNVSARKQEHFVNEALGEAGIRCRAGVRRIEIRDQIPALDRFWARLRAEKDRALAARDGATLAWRVSDPDLTLPPLALAYYDGDQITALALAYYSKLSEVELPVLEIMDLIALTPYQDAAIPALLGTILNNAARLGASRVRLSVTNDRLEPYLAQHASARSVYGHNHGQLRLSANAPANLRGCWAPTPYDGDLALSLRSPPLRRRR